MKPRSSNTSWRILRAPAYILGAFVLAFGVLVASKLLVKAPQVKAASAVLYPSFCLGGWAQAQNAAGSPGSEASSPSAYSQDDSAYLGSGVASQIFCGYFTTSDKANPPARVVVSFNWDMRDVAEEGNASSTNSSVASTSQQESYTSNSDYLVSPSTGFIVPVPTTTPDGAPSLDSNSSTTSSVPSASSTSPASNTNSTQSSSQDQTAAAASAAAAASSTPAPDSSATTVVTPPPAQTPPSETVPAAAPATPAATPAPADSSAATPAAAPAPSSDGTTSYLMPILSLIAPVANGSTDDPTVSDSPFLSVSYSTDGVRWTQIGTVGHDNWKNYRVAVPVTSWDDVNHLQIMLNVIPTLDAKPEIYLESMSARADYSRTVAEALAAAANSASDAADALVNKILDAVTPDPQPPKKPDPVWVYHKKLFVSRAGAVVPGPRSDITAAPDSSGDTLLVSGNCSKKYFVVLVYRDKGDYAKNPASYIANEARECDGGKFSYDLSSLSPEIRSGSYYLLTAEEDDTGPWKAVSGLFPIHIEASTTAEQLDQ